MAGFTGRFSRLELDHGLGDGDVPQGLGRRADQCRAVLDGVDAVRKGFVNAAWHEHIVQDRNETPSAAGLEAYPVVTKITRTKAIKSGKQRPVRARQSQALVSCRVRRGESQTVRPFGAAGEGQDRGHAVRRRQIGNALAHRRADFLDLASDLSHQGDKMNAVIENVTPRISRGFPPSLIVGLLERKIGKIGEADLAQHAACDDLFNHLGGLLEAPILGDRPDDRPVQPGVMLHQLYAGRNGRRARLFADHVLAGGKKKLDRVRHDLDRQRQVYEIDVRILRNVFKRQVMLEILARI